MVITLAAAASVVVWTPSLAGTTFTVTRFDDPGPGPCQPGDCSLREAVMAANAKIGGLNRNSSAVVF